MVFVRIEIFFKMGIQSAGDTQPPERRVYGCVEKHKRALIIPFAASANDPHPDQTL